MTLTDVLATYAAPPERPISARVFSRTKALWPKSAGRRRRTKPFSEVAPSGGFSSVCSVRPSIRSALFMAISTPVSPRPISVLLVALRPRPKRREVLLTLPGTAIHLPPLSTDSPGL
ncbi:hypothetical protein D3C81_1399220 [compost metagenome]